MSLLCAIPEIAQALGIACVTTVTALPPSPHKPVTCVPKVEFIQAVPAADDMARRLTNLAQMPSTSDETRNLFLSAATLIRLESRLLAISSWACAANKERQK
jgi:hypothetical protein